MQLGFEQVSNDQCLFRHPETRVRIVLHVDDLLVRGVRRHIDAFYEQLGKQFDLKPPKFMEDDGELEFVCIRITESLQNGQIWYKMDQESDIRGIISDSGIKGARAVAAPMHKKDAINRDPTPLTGKDVTKCMSDFGSLQYFVCGTQWPQSSKMLRLKYFQIQITQGIDPSG